MKDNKYDGNLAFKCAWNDAEYSEICSDEVCHYNAVVKKQPNCIYCKKIRDEEMLMTEYPCFESRLFVDCWVSAGGGSRGANRILGGEVGKILLLTTREPGDEEDDRYIFGYFLIEDIVTCEQYATEVYGDKKNSVRIHPDIARKMKLWDYYKNPGSPDEARWNTGLFRYPTDEGIYSFLCDLRKQYVLSGLSGKELKLIQKHMKLYEDGLLSR